MNLKQLGWNDFFASHFAEYLEGQQEDVAAPRLQPARVIEELKGHYRVLAEKGEYLVKVAGSMRFDAGERSDFPAVGDWVGIVPQEKGRATIQALLPRKTKLSRKVAGRRNDEQILAANVDSVFIVATLNQELNLRRIERYVALAWDSGAMPVVLLNKSDLAADPAALAQEVEATVPGVEVHTLSCVTHDGFSSLDTHLSAGKTCVFLGSSGVGKSTIVNALLGEASQSTGPVRASDDRGRHTTTSRHLFVLPRGAIVIDTPGMRELQLWAGETGVAVAFDDLAETAQSCKFRDCKHESEPGCAVREAIAAGELDADRLANYQKLEAEMRFAAQKTDQSVALAAKKRIKKLCGDQKRHYKNRE
jgi:ribosome biogenesis GTPase